MNPIEKVLQDYHNSKPEWPYPQLFAELKKAGVKSCETDAAKCIRKYSGQFGQWEEKTPTSFETLVINPVFSVAGLENSLKRRQSGEFTYEEFLRTSAESGIAYFVADMDNQTVTYYNSSKDQSYVQQVPIWQL